MIEAAVTMLGVYLALGLLFALVFHFVGLRRVDGGVAGGGWVFRLLITPGLVLLWPLMALAWRRALRGQETAGATERPLSAAGLRTWHRRLAVAVTLLVPPLALLAVIPPAPSPPLRTSVPPANRAILPISAVVETHDEPFPPLPIGLALRSAGGRDRQVELTVAEDLEIPSLGLFWQADGAERRVFLGTVWGPGQHRYPLPAGSAAGELELVSLAHGEAVGSPCSLSFRP